MNVLNTSAAGPHPSPLPEGEGAIPAAKPAVPDDTSAQPLKTAFGPAQRAVHGELETGRHRHAGQFLAQRVFCAQRGAGAFLVGHDGQQSVILPQVTFGIVVRMAVMSIVAGNEA